MKKVLLPFALLFFFCGCQKEVIIQNASIESDLILNSNVEHDVYENEVPNAVIGNRIPNPYSLENIKAAFNRLPEETKAGYSKSDIIATHTYIAFTPSQIEEAVRQSTTWTQWWTNLINNNPGVASTTDIIAAFDFWNSI